MEPNSPISRRFRRLILDGGVVLVDECDLERLQGRSVYLGSNGYAYFSTNKTGPVTLHSFVMGGATPDMHIDHINGNKLDNRRGNLRVVTAQMNQMNRRRLSKSNTSGARGVSRVASAKWKPWRAQIMVNRRAIHLGMFATRDEAIVARRAAEVEHFGVACPDV